MAVAVKERLSRRASVACSVFAQVEMDYLSLLALASTLDSVPTFDNIGLEAYRPRSPMQLEKKAAGIAEDRSDLVSSP